ncbi:MAG: bifunctional hydroxymethylpyrimidine kinase/phosphomethylpyrimidine kinase [Termitinemataceae bacterium]|nr:MAG: bifunctional hydroxymethylpyrimidine kinase/phosphomethylpyrimidine kinase [Termitinemataceae bacterium]
MKNVLSIAGSDSSGGAGVQADLKTMCALGAYGMTVITAITAQNTQGVFMVEDASAEIVGAQIKAVFDDIRVDAVKIGMVSSLPLINVIKEQLQKYKPLHIVLDPVMVSKSNCPLLKEDARSAIKNLAGIAEIVTPNIPEAEILSCKQIKNKDDMKHAALKIAECGVANVLIKGGHRIGSDSTDLLLCRGGSFVEIEGSRINTQHTHGTGCTLSSAIAVKLAQGCSVEEAVRNSKAYITQAIKDCYPVGKGVGPVGHLNALWRSAGLQF